MPHPAAPLRVAVVSTPRSGNTWVRKLIAGAYRLPELCCNAPAEVDWDNLPPELVVQLHWPREPEFLGQLDRHGFRVVTVARHPFDVLISILHWAVYAGESGQWLLGDGGDEQGVWGAWPRSRPFRDYAAGPRAAALLAVSADWWGQPGSVSARYEDFVADPAGELGRLAGTLGPPRCDSLAAVVDKLKLDDLKRTSANNHFWMGKPGLWRELLPAAEASEIARAIAPVLAALGYPCDPAPALTADAADRNWVRLTGPELGATLRQYQAGLAAKFSALVGDRDAARFEQERLRAAAAAAEVELATTRAELALARANLARLEARAADLAARLAPARGLGRTALRLARLAQSLRDRLPTFARRPAACPTAGPR
jgi:hypothetical protein